MKSSINLVLINLILKNHLVMKWHVSVNKLSFRKSYSYEMTPKWLKTSYLLGCILFKILYSLENILQMEYYFWKGFYVNYKMCDSHFYSCVFLCYSNMLI